MIEAHNLGIPRLLIEIAQVAEQIEVVDDPTNLALEVSVLDGIEP